MNFVTSLCNPKNVNFIYLITQNVSINSYNPSLTENDGNHEFKARNLEKV